MHVSIKMRSFCQFLVAFDMTSLFFYLLLLLYTFLMVSIFKIILRGLGTQSKKEFTAAFRECFSRLGELRSLAPQRPLTPMLALTATATLKTQQYVERSLCLRKLKFTSVQTGLTFIFTRVELQLKLTGHFNGL